MKALLMRFMRWWQKQIDPDPMRNDRMMHAMRLAIVKKEIEAMLGPDGDDK